VKNISFQVRHSESRRNRDGDDSSIPQRSALALSGVARKKIARPLKSTAPFTAGEAPLTAAPDGVNLLQGPQG
jgi:hypothetical protein